MKKYSLMVQSIFQMVQSIFQSRWFFGWICSHLPGISYSLGQKELPPPMGPQRPLDGSITSLMYKENDNRIYDIIFSFFINHVSSYSLFTGSLNPHFFHIFLQVYSINSYSSLYTVKLLVLI